VLQDASATGGVRGGNTQRSLADFGADTLMKTILQQLSSLGGLAGMGMGATNAVANFGQHTADNVSGALTDQGKNLASKDLAIGGINSQMWNNAGSYPRPGGVGGDSGNGRRRNGVALRRLLGCPISMIMVR
jgi:hypothetical protein